MSGAVAAHLADGRLHLQHGPIDLIVSADGAPSAVTAAKAAAAARFRTVLDELCTELPRLRAPHGPAPTGLVATRMAAAVARHGDTFVTPMAAVAGSVADEILDAMTAAAPLNRAIVNNGGDIAFALVGSRSVTAQIASPEGAELGTVRITPAHGIGGMATSGWRGRSLSLGIADSVTVLARTAADADVAATLIANAVDLPGHPAIARKPATALSPDSDLGERLATTGCGPLSDDEIDRALINGQRRAAAMVADGRIAAAALFLQGDVMTLGDLPLATCPRSEGRL